MKLFANFLIMRRYRFIKLFLLFFATFNACADPFPLQFAIPESKIVTNIPVKDKDFAHIIPGDLNTYIFNLESDYYKDYQRSYFAVTKKKGGWDCMRHYEILACGCIPYFLDLDKCDPNIMVFLPKELIKEAMNLPGVSYLKIDHGVFDEAKYHEILEKLLSHTREYLTTKRMAQYILDSINYKGEGKILYLSDDIYPDYMRCLMLVGLKELLQERVIDFPKVPHIYTNYEGAEKLYGKGFSYTKNICDLPMDRENIEDRIANKEFDLVIYGSVHRGLRYYDLVTKKYDKEQIVYLCGEDDHNCVFYDYHNLFLREFPRKEH